MTDVHSKAVRSKNMAAIKGRNTRPEILVRSALHCAGFRYRLHVATLPGKPDLVFLRYKAVIFVQGCFWHQHQCAMFHWPKTRTDWWRRKISANRAHDEAVQDKLGGCCWCGNAPLRVRIRCHQINLSQIFHIGSVMAPALLSCQLLNL